MKLLVYSHYFAPSIGGVETVVMSLARGLGELRAENGSHEFELTLVTQTPRNNFDDGALPFRVIREPGLWRLWNLVREADAVHVAGPSFAPMLLAWMARTPFFVEHHTYQAICPNGLLIHQPDRAICPGHFQLGNYRECRKCETFENSSSRAAVKVLAAFPRRALVGRAAANIAVSEHVKRRLGAPRSIVIYHGIEEASKVSTALKPTAKDGQICFAFVGRFVPEKGIPIFLDAIAKLKREGRKFTAKLIGDGPERAKLEEQIAVLGLIDDVKITGYLSGEALAAEVADVAVIVMPSVWEETAGLAAMEQMMRTRLVICSNAGGLAEIVDEAGLTFRLGDGEDLAEKLRRVLLNPQLIQTIGNRARTLVESNFLLKAMIEKHAETYRKQWQKYE